MSLYESNARLERAGKDLVMHWNRTQEYWRDSRSQQVERRLVEPLVTSVKQAGEGINRLQNAVMAARRECSEG